jgi:polysaccharide pyruvyl transferase WcaK-like protein
MTSSIRLLVIADVGGAETRHIGDEAMLEANLDAFRSLIPEVAFTVVSRDPAWTAAHYGVDAVAPFGFPRDPSSGVERGAMLDRLLAAATGRGRGNPGLTATPDTTNATCDAVFDADGLVVSGGGNLSSTWPDCLYERVALLHLARIFGKPAVVLGQTIGPRLAGDERRLLAETLSSARFVGLRELPSAALALELGVPPERIWYQSDDALFFKGAPESVQTSDRSSAPRIAVTIDPQVRAMGEAVFDSLVSQLRELSQTTDAPLILIPHAFGNESAAGPSDLTEARLLAERLGLSHTVVAAGLDAGQARQLTGDASMIISTRYHPIVFGLAAGVPSLGIYGDEYCRIKLQGALAHARLERWTLRYDEVTRGELLTKALELWHARSEVRRQLESHREVWREESQERWRAVLRALEAAKTIPPAAPATIFGRPIQDVVPALVSALEARRQWWQWERESGERLAARCDDLQRRARSLENEIGVGKAVRRYASAVRSKLRRIALRKP